MDRVEGQRDENNIISPTKSDTSDLEENNIPPSHSTLHAKNRLQTSTVVGEPPPDKVRKKEILPSGNTIYHMVDGSTLIHTPGGKIRQTARASSRRMDYARRSRVVGDWLTRLCPTHRRGVTLRDDPFPERNYGQLGFRTGDRP